MDDYFAVFDLPRKLGLDEGDLQRRFYELSKRYHPDFHRAAGAPEQAAVLARSALVNRAYRALRDPMSRVECLIALEERRDGREGGADRPRAPADLLQEMLEVQESLEEARAGGLNESSRRRLERERAQLLARDEAERAAVLGRIAEWDATVEGRGDPRPLLEWFKQRLATRAYLRTVIADLGEALGEEELGHGAHRRH
jgi:molecular chaperone HscB